jgi:glutaminyl-tRNA synthetase
MAVLEPLKLVLDNWDEVMGQGTLDDCSAPVHPHNPEQGKRHFDIGKEVWIELSDFEETPAKGFFRLFPGNKVRLKYAHVIECTGCEKNAQGEIIAVHANLVADTKSGTPGADSVKVKGVITWVNVSSALPAQVRLYERLFVQEHPEAGTENFLDNLNPDSLRVVTAYVEPSLAGVAAGQRFQFERHGYFVTDLHDHSDEKIVFNRITGMKDSWGK